MRLCRHLLLGPSTAAGDGCNPLLLLLLPVLLLWHSHLQQPQLLLLSLWHSHSLF